MHDARLNAMRNCDYAAESVYLSPHAQQVVDHYLKLGMAYYPVITRSTIIWFRCLQSACGVRFRARFDVFMEGRVICPLCRERWGRLSA